MESARRDGVATIAGLETVATDEELVGRFRDHGDRDALSELIRRYAPRLRRLLYSLLGPDDEAVSDAEQEVYVSLIRRVASFRGASRFSTFFYSLARNRTIDLVRARSRDRTRVTRSEDPHTAPGLFAGPERLLDDQERASLVRTALRRLAPEDQFLLYMKDGEGVRLEELVEITGRPSGTIKSRLARARRKLARNLEEMGYEHE
jgi:RNA polymerase sigma-70 factor, ECF subfamily